MARALLLICFTALLFAATVPGQGAAHAQDEPSQVESNFQATIGLGLVGAELGLILPAAFGMDDWWPYVVFPVVGGAAGALAGYFAIDEQGNRDASMITLVAGIGLALPSIIFAVWLGSQQGDADVVRIEEDEDDGSAGDELQNEAEQAQRDARDRRRRSTRRAAVGGVFQFSEEAWGLGVPAISVAPESVAGTIQGVRFSLGLVSGAF